MVSGVAFLSRIFPMTVRFASWAAAEAFRCAGILGTLTGDGIKPDPMES